MPGAALDARGCLGCPGPARPLRHATARTRQQRSDEGSMRQCPVSTVIDKQKDVNGSWCCCTSSQKLPTRHWQPSLAAKIRHWQL